MTETLSILYAILTLSLLSACGSSGNDAPSQELLFEQASSAAEEETPSEGEPETEQDEAAQETQAQNIETGSRMKDGHYENICLYYHEL